MENTSKALIIAAAVLIAILLMFFVPKIFTAIAFDSGGVASGPMTATFLLPLAVGACTVIYADSSDFALKMLTNGYGVVALVAMMPLITIQIMGFRAIVASKVKSRVMMKNILDADDEQIIDFM